MGDHYILKLLVKYPLKKYIYLLQKIDEVDLRVEKVTKEVDKTNNILKASNARLKELIKKVCLIFLSKNKIKLPINSKKIYKQYKY